MTQKFLQIISGIILVYYAIWLSGFSTLLLKLDSYGVIKYGLFAIFSIPSLVLIFTAFCQLFRQRKGLVKASAILTILTLVPIFWTVSKIWGGFSDPADSNPQKPAFELRVWLEMIFGAASFMVFMLIPIYTNFRNIPERPSE